MSRLTSSIVQHIGKELPKYNREIAQKTGYSLKQIACSCAGLTEDELHTLTRRISVGVVPITCGQGKIKGFGEAVKSIIRFMGFECFVTNESDVAGIAEGIRRGAQILFMADDNCFIALGVSNAQIVDNSVATAKAYVYALHYITGGLEKRDVLLIGAGRVGMYMVSELLKFKARVAVFDIIQKKMDELCNAYGTKKISNLNTSIGDYKILLNASTAADIISPEHIKSDTYIASCGIPHGLTKEAFISVKEQLIHDPLQLGVATMLTIIAAGLWESKQVGGRSEGSHRL